MLTASAERGQRCRTLVVRRSPAARRRFATSGRPWAYLLCLNILNLATGKAEWSDAHWYEDGALIKANHGIGCISTRGRNLDHALVHTSKCDKSSLDQQWSYNANTGQIKNKHGICLASIMAHVPASEVRMKNCDPLEANQQWQYHSKQGLIKNKHGICLHAAERDTEAGKVLMEMCDGPTVMDQENNNWRFVKDAFSKHVGYLSGGGDLFVKKLTIPHAQKLCKETATCKGFTFTGSEVAGGLHECYFKSKWDVQGSGWTSYKYEDVVVPSPAPAGTDASSLLEVEPTEPLMRKQGKPLAQVSLAVDAHGEVSNVAARTEETDKGKVLETHKKLVDINYVDHDADKTISKVSVSLHHVKSCVECGVDFCADSLQLKNEPKAEAAFTVGSALESLGCEVLPKVPRTIRNSDTGDIYVQVTQQQEMEVSDDNGFLGFPSPKCTAALGQHWELVRRTTGDSFPYSDQLAGTETAGTAHDDPMGSNFTKEFASRDFGQFLFATGDCSHWMILEKDDVLEWYNNMDRKIVASHVSSEPYHAKMFRRRKHAEDPFISFSDVTDNCGLLYVENNIQTRCHSGSLASTHGGLNVFVSAPPAHLFTRWQQSAGDHAMCAESGRITASCGSCGPWWGDRQKCQALCQNDPRCTFYAFLSDNSCRLYSSCAATWNQQFGWGRVLSSIYQKGGSGAVESIAPPTYEHKDHRIGDHSVCQEDGRIQVSCGSCGPNWGARSQCEDLCNNHPTCTYYVYFSDQGCRIYSKCDSMWDQDWKGGSVTSLIYKKGSPAPTPPPTPSPPRNIVRTGQSGTEENVHRLASTSDGSIPAPCPPAIAGAAANGGSNVATKFSAASKEGSRAVAPDAGSPAGGGSSSGAYANKVATVGGDWFSESGTIAEPKPEAEPYPGEACKMFHTEEQCLSQSHCDWTPMSDVWPCVDATQFAELPFHNSMKTKVAPLLSRTIYNKNWGRHADGFLVKVQLDGNKVASFIKERTNLASLPHGLRLTQIQLDFEFEEACEDNETPMKSWSDATCVKQKAAGKCQESWNTGDTGYCKKTCGHCTDGSVKPTFHSGDCGIGTQGVNEFEDIKILIGGGVKQKFLSQKECGDLRFTYANPEGHGMKSDGLLNLFYASGSFGSATSSSEVTVKITELVVEIHSHHVGSHGAWMNRSYQMCGHGDAVFGQTKIGCFTDFPLNVLYPKVAPNTKASNTLNGNIGPFSKICHSGSVVGAQRGMKIDPPKILEDIKTADISPVVENDDRYRGHGDPKACVNTPLVTL